MITTKKMNLRELTQRILYEFEEKLLTAFYELKKRIHSPHTHQKLEKPNLPSILFEALNELASRSFGIGMWGIEIFRKASSSIKIGELNITNSKLYNLGIREIINRNIKLTCQCSNEYLIEEFIFSAEKIIKLTIEMQSSLLKSFLFNCDRIYDDLVCRSFLQIFENSKTRFIINFSDLKSGLTRILCGGHHSERIIDMFSLGEILDPQILAALDIIFNWSFKFESTNTYSAFKNLKQGQSCLYFPNWTKSVDYFGVNESKESDYLKAILMSDGLCGESDYLLTPIKTDSSTLITICTHGTDEKGMRDILQQCIKFLNIPTTLERPKKQGYYHDHISTICEAMRNVIQRMTSLPFLFLNENEKTINHHLAERLRHELGLHSHWNVEEEPPHGTSNIIAGKPDIVIHHTITPNVTIVCECKNDSNFKNVVRQTINYIRPGDDAVFIVVYQKNKSKKLWKTLKKQLSSGAEKINLKILYLEDQHTYDSKIPYCKGYLLSEKKAERYLPLYLFLVDFT